MDALKVFIRNHPVVTYFALTFAISWGGVLTVIGGSGGRWVFKHGGLASVRVDA